MSTSTMLSNFDLTTNPFIAPILDGFRHILPKIPEVVFGVIVGILLISVLTKGLRFILTITGIQVGLRDVLVSLVRILLWLFLAMSVFQVFYPNVIIFFSGSIAAIGLAMAAGGSTLVSDIIAGIFLARDTDFNVGDEVVVGETPVQGIIESIDARRIRLRDDDGVLHIIPNSVVERKEWILIHRKGELTTIARAAQKLKAVAVEKAVERREAASRRVVRHRKFDQ